jgi:hypothetical protein
MTSQTVSGSVTSKVRTGIFEVFGALESEEANASELKAITKGKVSLAYTGGGKWLALCVDGRYNQSSTVMIEVRKDGTVVTVDRGRGQENHYGKVDLGKNGVPRNYFEVDLLKHYTSLKDLLEEEIAHRFSKVAPSLSAEVRFG